MQRVRRNAPQLAIDALLRCTAFIHPGFHSACAGSVRVQASRIEGTWSKAALALGTSSDVALTDCVVIGADGLSSSQSSLRQGGSGVEAVSSQIAVYGGELRGGAGNFACHGGAGGHGLSLKASYGFAADALLGGGAGGNAQYLFAENGWPSAGNGGDGIRVASLAGAASHLDHLATQPLGAAAGSADHGCGCNCEIQTCCFPDEGINGSPILIASSANSATAFPGPSPRLAVATNPVREQSQVSLTFFGQPGDLVSLIIGSETGFAPKAAMKGVRLVERQGLPLALIIGTIGPTGMLTHAWTLGDLGAGVQSRIVHMQSLHRNAAGHLALGNPVHLVELDQAF